MQVALCESIPFTFCEDPGDSRRINSVTESETNASQNPYGSCAVDGTDTAYFYHLFHFQEGCWVTLHLIKPLPILLYEMCITRGVTFF